MIRHLHIISFAVPYPVDYGGLFDVYYKINELASAGIHVHLHCFTNNDSVQPHLNQLCDEVYYYKRKGPFELSPLLPYIVSSRQSEALEKRLLMDDYPILIEGVHCSRLLTRPEFAGRKIFLRLFNVEYLYYSRLAETTRSLPKKIYFLLESFLLRKYERNIAKLPERIFCMSETDMQLYRNEFAAADTVHLPAFTGFMPNMKEGVGSYCLYHGNLSVPENEKAVAWLLNDVFRKTDIPIMFAGKNPSPYLQQLIRRHRNAKLVANPTREELEVMVVNAQCHVLPSFNSTGVKLKLIHALFNGRHCIGNSAAVNGSAMGEVCTVADSSKAFLAAIEEKFIQNFSRETINTRIEFLKQHFNDEENCTRLIRWIW